MPNKIHADLKNDTNHRNVFTITDTVVDKVLFEKENMDADEIKPSVELAVDDDGNGQIKWEIKGQIGGSKVNILDGDTVLMD